MAIAMFDDVRAPAVTHEAHVTPDQGVDSVFQTVHKRRRNFGFLTHSLTHSLTHDNLASRREHLPVCFPTARFPKAMAIHVARPLRWPQAIVAS